MILKKLYDIHKYIYIRVAKVVVAVGGGNVAGTVAVVSFSLLNFFLTFISAVVKKTALNCWPFLFINLDLHEIC